MRVNAITARRVSLRSLMIAAVSAASFCAVLSNPGGVFTDAPWNLHPLSIVHGVACASSAVISVLLLGGSVGYDFCRSRMSIVLGCLAVVLIVIAVGAFVALIPVVPSHPPKGIK